jgi:hypothetical protein
MVLPRSGGVEAVRSDQTEAAFVPEPGVSLNYLPSPRYQGPEQRSLEAANDPGRIQRGHGIIHRVSPEHTREMPKSSTTDSARNRGSHVQWICRQISLLRGAVLSSRDG